MKVLLFILFFISCNFSDNQSEKFSKLNVEEIVIERKTKAEIEFCESKEAKTTSVGLLIYVVDFSGSNLSRSKRTCPASNPSCDCYSEKDALTCSYEKDYYIGTDEDHKRVSEIINHVNQLEQQDNRTLNYAFVPFGAKSLPSCYNIFNGKSFTGNKQEFIQKIDTIHTALKNEDQALLNSIVKEECQVETNYEEGLLGASAVKKQFFEHLKETQQEKPDISVMLNAFVMGMFLSDGSPITIEDNKFKLQTAEALETKVKDFITGDVSNLLANSAINNAYVSLSTAYYSQALISRETGVEEQPQAFEKNPKDLLAFLAQVGNGQAHDLTPKEGCEQTNSCGPNYQDFVIPDLILKFNENIPFITIKNTIWENGILKVDSDGDGLSDDLEIELEIDENSHDTDNDGYSDFAEFIYSGISAITTPSSIRCTNKDIDTDLDGITDCDELLAETEVLEFDQNHNLIPDGIEFYNLLDLSRDESSIDSDGDGISNIKEITANTPLKHSNHLIQGLSSQKYTVVNSDKPSCKRLVVDDLKLPFDQNEDQVYKMEVKYLSSQENSKVIEINTYDSFFKEFESILITNDKFTEKFYQED